MALECRIVVAESGWLGRNVDLVRRVICGLSTFVVERQGGEFWLKDAGAGTGWDFDARLFVERDSLFVEISSKTRVLQDIKDLYDAIACKAPTTLQDDDDPGENLDPGKIFASSKPD